MTPTGIETLTREFNGLKDHIEREEQLPAVVFFFITLIIFHDQIKSIKDFRLLGITWGMVCILWYGSSVIRKLIKKTTRKY